MEINSTSVVAEKDDIVLSEAMRQEIIEREKYIEEHPDEWISAEQSIKMLRERNEGI